MTILITVLWTSVFWGFVIRYLHLRSREAFRVLSKRLWEYQKDHSKEVQELKQTIHSLNEELLESKKLNVSRLVFDNHFGNQPSLTHFTLSHNSSGT